MNATDAAAWWGAITATLVFVWDIYKWIKSGSNLRITASPNMQLLYNEIPKTTDPKYVFVEVSNTGDKRTTITNLVGVCYQSFWGWLFWRKPDINFIVPTHALAKPLPYVLEPGERWSGMGTRRFYCGVCHSNKAKADLVRVRYKKTG
ncbi:MAG: hypothetical protein HW415_162 [Deltaproteobacteria bacterium]|nr:hypothetical protein [Deltaproteobacteria bacterium]